MTSTRCLSFLTLPAFILSLNLFLSCNRRHEMPGEEITEHNMSLYLDESGQLYNSSFDNWCRIDKVWYAFGAEADEGQRIWDSGNNGTITMGENNVVEEKDFLAVPGQGKSAARLQTRFVGVLGIGRLAAGSLFTGRFLRTIGTSGAELSWGLPYCYRPVSLGGYYCYKTRSIDRTDKAHKYLKGEPDTATIQVVLADWEGPFTINNAKDIKVDPENDPCIIGHALLEIAGNMDEYVAFDLPIEYRDERQPRYLVIAASSSKYGDYFTGGTGATLWIDEFSLKY
ncbi:MAG: PCMD domain-containing protein [Bacteroidales bacterium]|nr:PCMD domain-containing protein [Bacteroidales bacterium]